MESNNTSLSADDVFWNETVNYWVEKDFSDLSESHQRLYVAFFYDAEVNNGGHLQYFHNRGIDDVPLVQNALEFLKAPDLRENFDRAHEKFRNSQAPPIRSLQEFADVAMEDEFREEDDAFYDTRPGLWDLIEQEVVGNQSTYRRPN